MSSALLIWVLGLLTLATGALLVVMWRRRQEAQAQARAAQRAAIERDATPSRKLVDAYAIPVGYDKPPPGGDSSDEPGKICPVCGRRYAYHYRVCARDDSELATLN